MNKGKTHNSLTMKKMILFSVLTIAWISCSLNLDMDSDQTISQADIDAVSQIIGESLSDENAGMIGSFYDAITSISGTGFVRSPGAQLKKGGHDENSGRGNETNLNYLFNTQTGEHELSFERLVTTLQYRKEVTDTLRYIYTDKFGSFISDLSVVSNTAHSIKYTAARNGEIETSTRLSFFVRNDTFLISGLEGSSSEILVDGVHRGSGIFQSITSTDSSQFERRYELEVNFLNIRITKSVLEQNISLEQGVIGALTYSLLIEDPNNRSISRRVKGSLDMVGDGTATLRFNNAPGLFQVNLDNGTVNDQKNEFEGRIKSVDVSGSIFTLASGLKVNVTEQTTVSAKSDLFTLEAVRAALLTNPTNVRAKGEGNINGQVFRASEVEFELDDDNDDDNDDLEFEQEVQAVDMDRNTFTLQNGTVIGVDNGTVFESDGDYLSLNDVANALNNEIKVIADGEARYIDSDILNYIAIEVEFEDGENDSEEERINFDGNVESVNLSASTLTLDTGAVIRITGTTSISGDMTTLQAVQNGLNAGQRIEADGKGKEDKDDQEIDLIALEIKFKIKD